MPEFEFKTYVKWLPILPSEELILCNCSRERIGGKLEKKMAASVFGSRVAADDPASCQVSYSFPHSIVWTGNLPSYDCLNWPFALSLFEMGICPHICLDWRFVLI